ncbi:MAG: hypothetical protein ABEJ24_03915 [Candidatus Magasanikbacteria bacterium]
MSDQELIRYLFISGTIVASLSAILYFFYYQATKLYQRGYKTGKKIVKNFKDHFQEELVNRDGSLKDKTQKIQEDVFDMGFSKRKEEYKKEINSIKSEIEEINSKFDDKISETNDKYEQKKEKIRNQIKKLEKKISESKDELERTEREQPTEKKIEQQEKEQDVKMSRKGVNYLKSRIKEGLDHLQEDLLLFLLFIAAITLVTVDYFIGLSFIRSVFKVQINPTVDILGFSVSKAKMIGLGFTLGFWFTIEMIVLAIKKFFNNYISFVVKITLFLVGIMLFASFAMMVLAPNIEGMETILFDLAVRLLFIPIMITVAGIMSYIYHRHEEGRVFLFTPFKVLSVIFLPFLYILESFESNDRDSYVLNKTPEEKQLKSKIKRKNSELKSKKNKLEQVEKEQTEEIKKIEQQLSDKVNKLHDKKSELKKEISSIREGCNLAVTKYLSL